MFASMIRILAILLICLTAAAGCNQSNDAENAPPGDKANAAKMDHAQEKPRPVAQEDESARLKAAQAEVDQSLTVIKQLGGKVEHDPNFPGQPVIMVDLRGTKLSDAGLSNLRGLKHLKILYLGGNQITDAGLVHLATFPALEELTINEGGGQVTDAGLIPLAGMKSLKKLIFGAFTKISGAGLEGLTSLEWLDIAYAAADDGALKHIGKLANLRYLRLDHNQVITDSGLVHVKGLKRLQTVGLYNVSQVSDAGLESLQDLKDLKTLLLQGTKVTDAGVKRLKAAIPACAIEK